MKNTIINTLLISLALQASLPAQEDQNHKGGMLGSDYNLKQEIDRAELNRLAKAEEREFDENRRLWQMIVHAGIKKDGSLKALLNDKPLRASDSSVDLALSAYDYMLNKDERALDHILAFLATESVGADTDTIIILSAINEWDRSIKAFKKHFYVIDGAGGANYRGFLEVRSYLYPEHYLRHKKEIES